MKNTLRSTSVGEPLAELEHPVSSCSQDIREPIYAANVRDSLLFTNGPYFASPVPVLLHEIKMDTLLVSKQMTSEFRMAYSGLI